MQLPFKHVDVFFGQTPFWKEFSNKIEIFRWKDNLIYEVIRKHKCQLPVQIVSSSLLSSQSGILSHAFSDGMQWLFAQRNAWGGQLVPEMRF